MLSHTCIWRSPCPSITRYIRKRVLCRIFIFLPSWVRFIFQHWFNFMTPGRWAVLMNCGMFLDCRRYTLVLRNCNLRWTFTNSFNLFTSEPVTVEQLPPVWMEFFLNSETPWAIFNVNVIRCFDCRKLSTKRRPIKFNFPNFQQLCPRQNTTQNNWR